MKKITLISLFILFAFTSLQAQTDKKEKTVTVTGSALLQKTITNYRIKATLSMDQVYYADTRIENLAQLKKQYFDELKQIDIDTSKFEEKELEYFSLGYQRDGTILYYTTDSKEVAMKLMQANLLGVQLQFQVKQHVSKEKIKSALDIALKDAKENADTLCNAIDTSVGEIISISSNQYNNEDWVSYYTDYQEQYTVSIVYKMN
ncbi:SIMPL domain-containing protein [Maribacter sp. SA7]|uniref:SIMPL domain-containing protein n=1 Tax=Maribacter zhoushanensis TaxID=3030012 RepID=UPI0023EC400A|nr:SIMPL domain-containing protein [Maribacter zhoushanensis]MDF4202197.1 SIMPL domain-containing protein [Maribacter zhoushanensis]